MFKIRTLKTPIIPPTNIIRSIFVNEMFLNAGNRVKNKRIELVSKPVNSKVIKESALIRTDFFC